MIKVEELRKSFVLHQQGGLRLPVLDGAALSVSAGECVVLEGHSGVGKSTFLRCLYGNYKADAGRILVRHGGAMVDVVTAEPRQVVEMRSRTLGYVSQFLRVIPRVSALEIVAEPLRALGLAAEEARERGREMLRQLAIPERLWPLPPATFSGGEQQRVNIARGFIAERPVLLLDEPTAALDAENRARVVDLVRAAKARGAALIGIFHDAEVRKAVATRGHPMTSAGVAA